MKIAVLGTRGFPRIQGGVEAHCENLYPRLAALGCEITVFSRRPYVTSFDPDFKGVRLVPLSCPKQKIFEAFVHTLKGLFWARRLKPDILHIHAVGPSLLIPLARLLGFKVVMTHHGPDYQRKKWGLAAKILLKLGEYLGCRFANEVIVISSGIAEDIQKKYGRKTNVIPNGVVVPEISKTDEVLKELGLTKGKYILSVGRFVPEKGFHDLMEAFIKFQAESPKPESLEWKLVIAGRADHEDNYSRGLIQKARENKNIILPGYLDRAPLAELYSHAGLFVLPSYYEGMPIVLLEAMAYGLASIISDIPANKNVGSPDDIFFKAGDFEALKEKIASAVDKPLTHEQRQERIKMISQDYDWEKIADKTLAVYQKVLNRI